MPHTFPVAFAIAILHGTAIFGLGVAVGLVTPRPGASVQVINPAMLATINGVLMSVFIMGDLARQRNLPGHDTDDLEFYPQFRHAADWLRCPAACWTLILGTLYLLFYNASLLTDRWRRAPFLDDWDWTPGQIATTLLCLYGLVWIADCLVRPRRGTITAAAGFTLLNFCILLSRGVDTFARY